MVQPVIERIVASMIEKKVIPTEDRQLYACGLYQSFLLAINIVSSIMLGIIFGSLVQSALLITCYIPLRSYSGGYHCKTPLRCYLFSVISLSVVLAVIKYQLINGYFAAAVLILSVLVIVLLSPMESHNKPLDEEEKRVFRKRALGITLALAVVLALFLVINQYQFALSVLMAFALNAVLLLLGKIDLLIKKRAQASD